MCKYGNNNDDIIRRKRHIILYKSYFISLCFLLCAVIIVINIFLIQHKGDPNLINNNNKIKYKNFPYKRGNIFSSDKHVIAMSVLRYDVHIDLMSISNKSFRLNIKKLCNNMENILNKPSYFFYKKICYERHRKNKYFLLAKDIDYYDLKRLKNLPILNNDKKKGGIIIKYKMYRINYYGINRYKKYYNKVSNIELEKLFNPILSGTNGCITKKTIHGKLKKISIILPKHGKNVYSTIQFNIQNSLRNILKKFIKNKKRFCITVIVMKINNGKILSFLELEKKNIKNKKNDTDNMSIYKQFSIGSMIRPILLFSILEDRNLLSYKYVKNILYDNTARNIYYNHKNIKYIQTFLKNDNSKGIEKIIFDKYKRNPEKFIQFIKKWHLGDTLYLGVPKKVYSNIQCLNFDKNVKENEKILINSIFGDNIKLTPIQILTFYNTIINQGKIIIPFFIKNNLYKSNSLEIKEKNIITRNKYLIKNILYNNYIIKYDKCNKNIFLVGYFPRKTPKYSCIICISNFKNPIKKIAFMFKEIIKMFFMYCYIKK